MFRIHKRTSKIVKKTGKKIGQKDMNKKFRQGGKHERKIPYSLSGKRKLKRTVRFHDQNSKIFKKL